MVELRVLHSPPPPPPLFSQCEAHGPPIGVGREKKLNAVNKKVQHSNDISNKVKIVTFRKEENTGTKCEHCKNKRSQLNNKKNGVKHR